MGKLADRSAKSATRSTRATRAREANLSARAAARARRGSREQIGEGVAPDSGRSAELNPIRAAGPTLGQTATELNPIRAAGPALGQTATDSSTELLEEIESSAIEDQIEEREDILDDSGGSSEATEVLGDDEGEELTLIKNEVLMDFRAELSADGFYQSIKPIYKSLSFASVESRAKAKSNTSILIGKTYFKSGRTILEDFRGISGISPPRANFITKRIIYSDLERSQITSKIVSSEKLNQAQLLQSMENFLEAPQSPSFEGSIVTNRFESTKKLKLSAVSENLPALTTQTTEPAPTQTTEAESETINTERDFSAALSSESRDFTPSGITPSFEDTQRDLMDGVIDIGRTINQPLPNYQTKPN